MNCSINATHIIISPDHSTHINPSQTQNAEINNSETEMTKAGAGTRHISSRQHRQQELYLVLTKKTKIAIEIECRAEKLQISMKTNYEICLSGNNCILVPYSES
eukprot:scaffold55490_cov61-Cyclotella_meneghiniana.AAC.3